MLTITTGFLNITIGINEEPFEIIEKLQLANSCEEQRKLEDRLATLLSPEEQLEIAEGWVKMAEAWLAEASNETEKADATQKLKDENQRLSDLQKGKIRIQFILTSDGIGVAIIETSPASDGSSSPEQAL